MSSAQIRKNMVSFMTRNHPCSIIDSIEKEHSAYKIHLMNGLCLVFDADGLNVKSN